MKLVIQNGSLVWGGNEKWAATLAGGLLRRGHSGGLDQAVLVDHPVPGRGRIDARQVVGHLAAHGHHFGELEVRIALDLLGHLAAVDVGEVHVEQEHVGAQRRGEGAVDFEQRAR